MKLKDLVEKIGPAAVFGALDREIKGISYHSSRAGEGHIFVAIKGARSAGTDFAPEAISRGAVAVVAGSESRRPELIAIAGEQATVILVDDPREALAKLSCAFCGEPSKKVKLVGVTGTNGKTTTTYLIDSVFKEAGCSSGIIGTISYRIGDKTIPADQTTPESLDLQEILRDMADRGINFCAMEVSSHAVDQKRVAGCEFEVAIFTNFTQDHLDYHGTMQRYYEAKRALFHRYTLKSAVVNWDDPRGRDIAEGARCKLLKYGLGPGADIQASSISSDIRGSGFRMEWAGFSREVRLCLPGRHNVYNALAAFGAALGLGIDPEVAVDAIQKVKSVPGRFEIVSQGRDFAVIVDYAHTEDALRKVLEAARKLTPGKLITVFGCGGDRDRSKRPLMAEAAASLSDYVVITSDNPRSEEPELIADEIEAGLKRLSGLDNRYARVLDRREAIHRAVRMAAPGDTVVIAGKGHENYQVIGGKKIEFDDRAVAREAIAAKLKCARI